MKKAKLMGVLNCTPDSFYDGGRYLDHKRAIQHGYSMIEAGADILDIGGESSRPGAASISEEEEEARVLEVVQELATSSVPISIDTVKPGIARKAIEAGATMINDIRGFSDPEMQEIAATSGLEIVVMHMQKCPENMQEAPTYPQGVVTELLNFFQERVEQLVAKGVKEEQIIIDPGIGFGKTNAHIYDIIHNLHRFRALGFPVLFGASRKSFISRILNKPPQELLSATVAVHTMALLAQVDLIRVHDVLEHRDVIDLLAAVAKT